LRYDKQLLAMYIALAVFIAKFCKMYTNFSLAHTNSYREIFA